MTSRTALFEQFEELGIPRDVPVVVHASLRSVGEVEDRGEGLLDALIAWVTRDKSPEGGLLCVPTHTWDRLGGPDPVTMDVKDERTCVGTLPTLALRRADAVCSLHPTHSMAVFGDPEKVRAWVAGEVMKESSTAPDGCWGKLRTAGGFVLLVGVGHNRNTYLHSVEEWLGVPNRLSPNFVPMRIRLASGDVIERPIRCHHTVGISEVSAKYPKYEPAFRAHGCIRDGFIGSAPTQLCDCAKMAEVVALVRERSGGIELLGDEKPLEEAYYL